MTNKPMLSVERNAFEAFWRATMNVEVMDLHRCEFPMTDYNEQPYACHETDRAWMTWKGRAILDNQAVQQQGEPVALQHIAVSEGGVLRWMTGRKMQHCELYAMPDGSAIRSNLYAAQHAPLKIGSGVTVENIGFGPEEERKPYLVFSSYGCLTEVNLIDVSLVSKRQAHTIADLEAIGVRVEHPDPVAVVMPEILHQTIRDTLRNYRMSTLDDGHGGGYPLIDAMTADGQPVSGGIEECQYLADAILNACIDEVSRLNGVKP